MVIDGNGTECGEPAKHSMVTTFEGGTPEEWRRNFWLCDKHYEYASEYELDYVNGFGDPAISRVTREEF